MKIGRPGRWMEERWKGRDEERMVEDGKEWEEE